MITYNNPSLVSESWGGYLFVALIGLILARLIEMFSGIEYKNQYSRIFSYIGVLIFSLFIMYDTKKLIINSNNCVNPDYINESLHLFIDSINLFQNLYHISD